MSNRKGIMLCYPFEQRRLEKWSPPYLVQPKLNGDRCRAIFDDTGIATLLSSEENEIRSVPHIVEQLEGLGLRDTELDGELYQHGTYHQDIHSIVSRTVNIHPHSEIMSYHIFDVVSTLPQEERLKAGLFQFKNLDRNIKTVPTIPAVNMQEVTEILEFYMSQNYEGIVVRNKTAPYKRSRSTEVMKFKPRKDDYYTIVGYEEEISIHGDPKGTLGAFILSSGEGLFNVGSGSFLTKESRKTLWAEKEKMIGAVAHVKYQHLSKQKVPIHCVLVDIIRI